MLGINYQRYADEIELHGATDVKILPQGLLFLSVAYSVSVDYLLGLTPYTGMYDTDYSHVKGDKIGSAMLNEYMTGQHQLDANSGCQVQSNYKSMDRKFVQQPVDNAVKHYSYEENEEFLRQFLDSADE